MCTFPWPRAPLACATADWFSISALAQRARRGRGGPEQRSYLTPEASVVPRGAAYSPARKRRGETVISAKTTCNKVYLTVTKCTLGSALRLYSRQSGQHLVSINHAVHLPSVRFYLKPPCSSSTWLIWDNIQVLSNTSRFYLKPSYLGQYSGFT